jgi:hypothetical protein
MLATPNPERQAHRPVREANLHIRYALEASSPIPAGSLEDMDRQIGIPSNPNDESPRKAVLALVAPEGGDIQIGARIVQGDVDAVVFLRDPLTAIPTSRTSRPC